MTELKFGESFESKIVVFFTVSFSKKNKIIRKECPEKPQSQSYIQAWYEKSNHLSSYLV